MCIKRNRLIYLRNYHLKYNTSAIKLIEIEYKTLNKCQVDTLNFLKDDSVQESRTYQSEKILTKFKKPLRKILGSLKIIDKDGRSSI